MVLSIAVIGGMIGGARWLVLRGHIGRRAWWERAVASTFWVGASVAKVACFADVSLTVGFFVTFS
jgi:hypothetical protein